MVLFHTYYVKLPEGRLFQLGFYGLTTPPDMGPQDVHSAMINIDQLSTLGGTPAGN